jgi:predicted kinase
MKKDNLKILILIGIPASGKSTWSKEYVLRHNDYIRVNRDDFRDMLKNSQLCENKIEDMITELVYTTIEASLAKKLNVIVDNTNLKAKYLDAIIERFKYQADIDFRIFDVSLQKAVERDNSRTKKVGEGVIKKMFKDYKTIIDSYNFQPLTKISVRPIIQPNFNSHLPNAVIFDIDGTLAHMGKREPYDWHKVDRDEVNRIVVEQIKFHRGLGRKILIVTGRDASCNALTKEWFNFYEIEFDEIFMRPKDDFRKDTIIKREIYNQNIKDIYNVMCIYDDRLQVLDMWYQEGLFTFNVNQGLINF